MSMQYSDLMEMIALAALDAVRTMSPAERDKLAAKNQGFHSLVRQIERMTKDGWDGWKIDR